MARPTPEEFQQVWRQVQSWPAADRLILTQMTLGSLRTGLDGRPPARRTIEEILAAAGPGPAPDDETVKRWIHEHRMEKYGS